MLKLTKIHFFKILTLYVLLASVAVCYFNIKKILAPARRRAFRCSDESLSHPFVEDTVSPEQLEILSMYLPMGIIAVVALMSSLVGRKSLGNWRCLIKCILNSIIILTLFLSGLAVERLCKSVAKIKMARLRPNFITVCNPTTSNGLSCDHEGIIMDEYECRETRYPSWATKTAFASFPSGHTSLTSYSMVFLICYLYLVSTKLKRFHASSSLVILIVQVLCFFMILFVGMSRVLDFRHHWSDVWAGFIGGSCIALIVNYYLKNQLENTEEWLNDVVSPAKNNDVDNRAQAV